SSFGASFGYRIYDSLAEVPCADLEQNDVVVEKFLPEKEENLFFVRHYEFLGDRSTCTRLASRYPIVKDQTVVRIEEIDLHPEFVEVRIRLYFDYVTFDYLLTEGGLLLPDTIM